MVTAARDTRVARQCKRHGRQHVEAPIGGGSGCAGAQTVCMGHTCTWVEAFEDSIGISPGDVDPGTHAPAATRGD